MEVKTNNVPRDLIGWEALSKKERQEFDYLLEDMRDEAEFFRYKGRVYDANEFMRCRDDSELGKAGWDGYNSDSYFSGIVMRFPREGRDYDYDRVIVGTYYS